ncbi:MAG: restriction endonuclease subunit S [Euryarchaeota archaeon]|nr:restriction endonuclease subunit S [Euryarchaeota archaeon]
MIKEENLPEGWKIARFEKLFDFEKKSKHKAGDGKEKGKYKFFTSSNIQSKFIDEFTYDGEYLIFGTGGNPSIHYCNDKFSTSADCFVTGVKNATILVKYVYYYFVGNMYLLEAGFKGIGLKHLSKGYLQKIKIVYPEDIKTQKKIVEILEHTEKLKEWRAEADKLTDKFLKSVFLEMFGDPINNTKGWEIKKLKDFGEIKTGNTPSRKEPEYYGDYIEWIKSDNINTPLTYLTESEEKLSKKGAEVGRIVPQGSILVTCIAGSLSCIGNVAIADRKVAFNQQINSITPKADVNELFLYHLILNSQNYLQKFSTQALKGIINKRAFESLNFIFPPSDLQLKFGKIAAQIEEIKKQQHQSKQQINDLFNVLMQKAFKGELAC